MAGTDSTTEREKLLCLQINTGRMRASHDLIESSAHQNKIDLVLISEPNKTIAKNRNWITDADTDVAIAILSQRVRPIAQGFGKGFVWIETKEVVLYSCYISPNIPMGEFRQIIDNLGDDIRRKTKSVVITGDFNAKAVMWSTQQDNRGRELADWLTSLKLYTVNIGRVPTFERRDARSTIDLTLCSEKIIEKIQDWRVLEEETLSWHKIIRFNISWGPIKENQDARKTRGWKTNPEKIPEFLEKLEKTVRKAKQGGASISAESLTTWITKACNATFSKKRRPQGKSEVHWWNEDISKKRKECIKARRIFTRANKRASEEEKARLWELYKQRRADLQKAITTTKKETWKKTLEALNQNIWGRGYQIVTNKIKRNHQLEDDIQMEEAKKLFPRVQIPTWKTRPPSSRPTQFDEQELLAAVNTLRLNKAPGPDNITPEIAKAAVNSQKEEFLQIANEAINKGRFPERWKESRLVLICKPKKQQTDATTYRPICLLNTMGKIMESMLCARLNQELEARGNLAPRQFGFRKGKSTIHAMEEVRHLLEKGTRKMNSRGFAILITLDVRNAFNTADWPTIIKAMKNKGISDYLLKIFKNYLLGRKIQVGQRGTWEMTCGVPQGSKVGPILWNIMYDEIFNISLPEGANIVGFADDIAIVVTAWTPEDLQIKANFAIQVTTDWLKSINLSIATEKTEAVLLAGRRTLLTMDIKVIDNKVRTSDSIKYLGVHFGKDMCFKNHIIKTAKKASDVARSLHRIMPNTGGPTSSRRQVLNSVVHSILLYAAPVWSGVMNIKKYKQEYVRIQRLMAIRISAGYRTISNPAALVLSGVIPINLLIAERTKIHKEGRDNILDIRKVTMEQWQKEWTLTTKGKWTKKLIPDVRPWVERKHGEMDFHLCQVLSGHGCFKSYLYKIQRSQDDRCVYCKEEDTAEHTLFYCHRWDRKRRTVEIILGTKISPDNLTTIMLETKTKWLAIQDFANSVMRTKEEDERKEKENNNGTRTPGS